MFKNEVIPGEVYRPQSRMRFYVYAVENTARGVEIFLSRSHPLFLPAIFKVEVPEISENIVEIKGVARIPGVRTKLAVSSSVQGIDPVGACIGPKGSRIISIMRELNNEKIDIIPYSEDEKELIALIRAFDATVPKDSDELMKKILPLVKERMKTLSEFESLADFFFVRPVKFEWELKKDMLTIAKNALVSGSKWEHDAMEKAIRDASDKAGVKARDVFMELRIAITGKSVGPPLLESLEILGKEETLARLA